MLAAAASMAEFPNMLEKIFINKEKNVAGIN
jgi:hypothetical protein